jgi:hypothetical protein
MFLAAADPRGFESIVTPVDETLARMLRESSRALSPSEEERQADLETLDDLIRRMDQYMAGEIFLSAEELNIMEMVIARLRSRYRLP